MAKRVKGFLFGISLFIVAITIFTIAVLISKSQKANIDLTADLAKADRLYDISSSIEESFREIFDVSSGISIWVNNKNTTFFREELPSKYLPRLVQNYSSFQTFMVNVQQPDETITMFNLVANPPLLIKPANINYNHPASSIAVNPSTANFPGYNVTIETTSQITTYTPSTAAGTMKFYLTRIDPIGKTKAAYLISHSSASTFTIVTAAGTTTITAGGSPSGRLLISTTHSLSNAINVTTGILTPDTGSEQLTVEYPYNIYNVSLPKFEIFHAGNVKLRVFDPLLAAT